MTANEISVHAGGRTEIEGHFNDEKVPKSAVAQHSVDLVVRQTSFVVSHDGDFPGLEKRCPPLILPIDLGVAFFAFVVATSFVGGDVRLAANEGISGHGESF